MTCISANRWVTNLFVNYWQITHEQRTICLILLLPANWRLVCGWMEDGESECGVFCLLDGGWCDTGWRMARMTWVSAACWLEAGVRLVSRYLGRERMGEQRMTPPESPRDAPHNAGGQVNIPALSPLSSLLGPYISSSILLFIVPPTLSL